MAACKATIQIINLNSIQIINNPILMKGFSQIDKASSCIQKQYKQYQEIYGITMAYQIDLTTIICIINLKYYFFDHVLFPFLITLKGRAHRLACQPVDPETSCKIRLSHCIALAFHHMSVLVTVQSSPMNIIFSTQILQDHALCSTNYI